MPIRPEDNPKPFIKGQSGNPKGRPKSLISKIGTLVKQDIGIEISKTDKYNLIEWMLERTVPELKKIAANKQIASFVVVIAKAILKDIETGKMNTMDSMLDRLFGKPKQEVLSNVNLKPVHENKPDLSKLTDEELQTYKALVQKAFSNNQNQEL